jgi:hypothetical protein
MAATTAARAARAAQYQDEVTRVHLPGTLNRFTRDFKGRQDALANV